MTKRPFKLTLVQPTPTAALSPEEAPLFNEMLEAYRNRRLGALKHTRRSVDRDFSVISEFVVFAKQPPWSWTEEAFDRWCYHLGIERKLSSATQRHYQSAIRSFLTYLTANVKFRNEARRRFSSELVQICTAENCIPHVVGRELVHERRAMTHDEIDLFFQATDDAIDEARRFSSKSYHPLRRDKALFFTIYAAGLRASEAIGLDTTSFTENPILPEFGKFGFLSVWGKGSKGSGPKFRSVPVDHVGLPPLLTWYIGSVRPHFLLQADANEPALFLSERGQRLHLSTLESRFQLGLQRANLAGLGLSPHCMRHSSVSHGSMLMSPEAMRRKHGHEFAATTQGYTHFPDEFIGDEVGRIVDQQLGRALDGDSDDED